MADAIEYDPPGPLVALNFGGHGLASIPLSDSFSSGVGSNPVGLIKKRADGSVYGKPNTGHTTPPGMTRVTYRNAALSHVLCATIGDTTYTWSKVFNRGNVIGRTPNGVIMDMKTYQSGDLQYLACLTFDTAKGTLKSWRVRFTPSKISDADWVQLGTYTTAQVAAAVPGFSGRFRKAKLSDNATDAVVVFYPTGGLVVGPDFYACDYLSTPSGYVTFNDLTLASPVVHTNPVLPGLFSFSVPWNTTHTVDVSGNVTDDTTQSYSFSAPISALQWVVDAYYDGSTLKICTLTINSTFTGSGNYHTSTTANADLSDSSSQAYSGTFSYTATFVLDDGQGNQKTRTDTRSSTYSFSHSIAHDSLGNITSESKSGSGSYSDSWVGPDNSDSLIFDGLNGVWLFNNRETGTLTSVSYSQALADPSIIQSGSVVTKVTTKALYQGVEISLSPTTTSTTPISGTVSVAGDVLLAPISGAQWVDQIWGVISGGTTASGSTTASIQPLFRSSDVTYLTEPLWPLDANCKDLCELLNFDVFDTLFFYDTYNLNAPIFSWTVSEYTATKAATHSIALKNGALTLNPFTLLPIAGANPGFGKISKY